jgi:hypothetical protein
MNEVYYAKATIDRLLAVARENCSEEKAKKETGNSRGQQNTRQGASSRTTHCTQYKSFRR